MTKKLKIAESLLGLSGLSSAVLELDFQALQPSVGWCKI